MFGAAAPPAAASVDVAAAEALADELDWPLLEPPAVIDEGFAIIEAEAASACLSVDDQENRMASALAMAFDLGFALAFAEVLVRGLEV